MLRVVFHLVSRKRKKDGLTTNLLPNVTVGLALLKVKEEKRQWGMDV